MSLGKPKANRSRSNISFGGEDDGHSVDDFGFRPEFLQRQHADDTLSVE